MTVKPHSFYPTYWKDETVKTLNSDEKVIDICLSNNNDTRQSGIYKMAVEDLAFLLKVSQRKVIKSLEVLIKKDRILYDFKKGIVFVKNYFRNFTLDKPGNPVNMIEGIANQYSKNPSHPFWAEFSRLYKNNIIEKLGGVSKLNSLSENAKKLLGINK